MSSYHVLNAIWIGVFPMLAVSVLIAVLCYILCCLNQIKVKFKQYRKRKQLKKTRKKIQKQLDRDKQNCESSPVKQVFSDQMSPDTNEKNPLSYEKAIRFKHPLTNTTITNNFNNNNNNITDNTVVDTSSNYSLIKPQMLSNLQSTAITPSIPLKSATRSSLRLDLSNTSASQFKPIHADRRNSLEINPLKSGGPQLEQLVVEDLKESPTSAYARLNELARLAQEKR